MLLSLEQKDRIRREVEDALREFEDMGRHRVRFVFTATAKIELSEDDAPMKFRTVGFEVEFEIRDGSVL